MVTMAGTGDAVGARALVVVVDEREAREGSLRAHLAFRLHQAIADQVADGLPAVAQAALAREPVEANGRGPGRSSG